MITTNSTHPALVGLDGNPRTALPAPMRQAAFHGVVGRIVDRVAPYTEAPPEAILVTLLAAVGLAVGPDRFMQISADRHPAKVWPLLVGGTASGKGTSFGLVDAVMRQAVPEWPQLLTVNIASGEALVWAVRDAADRGKDHDPGVTDKRLFAAETEFGSLLNVKSRKGGTLSGIMRQAWDGDVLAHKAKAQPATATGAHVVILGHITPTELREGLTATDAANGFGNRFLFALIGRGQSLPRGQAVPDDVIDDSARELRRAIDRARATGRGRIELSEDYYAVFEPRYDGLREPGDDLAGCLLSRGAPYVHRLAVIYALLDGADTMTADHARAALAVWDYADESVRLLFDRAPAGVTDRRVLEVIRQSRDGLTRTELRDALGRNAAGLDTIVDRLDTAGHVTIARRETGGRPAERITATPYDHTTEHDQTPPNPLRSSLVVTSYSENGGTA